MFSSLKNNWKKSEAAVIVQDVLKIQHNLGYLEEEPGRLANRLVESLWTRQTSLLDGTYGQRPHKVAVAVASLANGVNLMKEADDRRHGVLMAMAGLLTKVSEDASLFAFNGIDERLLAFAVDVFNQEAAALDDNPLASVCTAGQETEFLDSGDSEARREAAAAFLETEVSAGRLTRSGIEAIGGMLSIGANLTGNLQEAYEMVNENPVDGTEFRKWLRDHPEGRQWKAIWVLIRQGRADTEYTPVD